MHFEKCGTREPTTADTALQFGLSGLSAATAVNAPVSAHLVREREQLSADVALVLGGGVGVTVLASDMIFEMVFLDELFLAVFTFKMTNAVVG